MGMKFISYLPHNIKQDTNIMTFKTHLKIYTVHIIKLSLYRLNDFYTPENSLFTDCNLLI